MREITDALSERLAGTPGAPLIVWPHMEGDFAPPYWAVQHLAPGYTRLGVSLEHVLEGRTLVYVFVAPERAHDAEAMVDAIRQRFAPRREFLAGPYRVLCSDAVIPEPPEHDGRLWRTVVPIRWRAFTL